MQECFYAGFPSLHIIGGYVSIGLMITDPGKLIRTILSFQMNHDSICGTTKAAFMVDAMPINAAFQSALSNDIVAEHPELWLEVRFCIMDDPIC